MKCICRVGIVGSGTEVRTQPFNRSNTLCGINFIGNGQTGKVDCIYRHTTVDIVSRVGNSGQLFVVTAQLGSSDKDIVLTVRTKFFQNRLGQGVNNITHGEDFAIGRLHSRELGQASLVVEIYRVGVMPGIIELGIVDIGNRITKSCGQIRLEECLRRNGLATLGIGNQRFVGKVVIKDMHLSDSAGIIAIKFPHRRDTPPLEEFLHRRIGGAENRCGSIGVIQGIVIICIFQQIYPQREFITVHREISSTRHLQGII